MTFSIVALCPTNLALGVGVCTASPAVGGRVPHVKANLAAVATQANTRVEYGTEGLRLLKLGFPPQTCLETMLKEDSQRETRQVIIIDVHRRTAAFTGAKTIPCRGHIISENSVVAGNMLAGKHVLEAMRQAFRNSPGLLAERILRALEAGEAAGGDKRGRLSAALVVSGSHRIAPCPSLRLHVDHAPNPVQTLRRLYEDSVTA
jgi:uncharacterized Ntn-hydrolase superfamily protein